MRLVSPEERLAATPLWVRLVDEFTGRRPAGPLEVLLERREGTAWVALECAHQISSRGDLGFLDLGRAKPGVAGSVQVRVSVSAPHTQSATAGGSASVIRTIDLWSAQAPPVPVPVVVRFFPLPSYAFGPGTPLLSGRALTAAGDPVLRAMVSVTELIGGSPVLERTLTDADGWFRLPLRWSSGATQVDATKGVLAGSANLIVPDDLDDVLDLTLT
ncbi:hypothetical protein [Terrabacter sp. RAF57]|uniref:hypothetical protein n=1 Tax=Terrabacter sp. RAF57 TaxID=3233063 RepID=UPI003F9A3512